MTFPTEKFQCCHVHSFFRQALRNFEKCIKPGGFLLIDHRNYDSIIDSGETASKSIYYNVSNQFVWFRLYLLLNNQLIWFRLYVIMIGFTPANSHHRHTNFGALRQWETGLSLVGLYYWFALGQGSIRLDLPRRCCQVKTLFKLEKISKFDWFLVNFDCPTTRTGWKCSPECWRKLSGKIHHTVYTGTLKVWIKSKFLIFIYI